MAQLLADVRAALAGRYGIERELGHGGMALVFLAKDLKHHRPVAIKVLRPELAAAIGPDRFIREIEVAARLTHPHILPVYDSGDANGFLYYVMPYVEGESLRQRLDRETRLPIATAVSIAREIADALSYAHQQGVVHRDVKPENILFQAGHAMLADFGIALAIAVAGGARLTYTGIAVGTPAYMSPEQAAGDRNVDARTDVYSLGCVLYEMLDGVPPVGGATTQSVLRQDLPASVAGALQRALAKAPVDRFATATEFAHALADVPIPVGARTRRLKAVLGAGALLLLLIAVALGVRARLRASPVIEPAARIAVIPFVPPTPDTSLERLGRELSITLASSLDGVGGIRTVDALTLLAQTKDSRDAASLQWCAALARRLGAKSLVHGSLVRAGPNVRLDLGLFGSDDLTPLAAASVVSAPENIAALTDSATWALLRKVWQRGAPPSPSLSAITTRSLPALRAFLDGERLYVAGDFESAARAYSRAIEADSSFWLAYWRYTTMKRVWMDQPVDSAITAAWLAHRAGFPERDRLLIEAGRESTTSTSTALLQSVTERFPDYWPAWWEYADELVHWRPLLGTGYEDARKALEQVVTLNPDLVVGWQHLFWVGTMQRDTAATARALRELVRLGWHGPPYFHFRYLDQLVRSDGVPDPALTDSGARYAVTHRPPEELVGGLSLYGFPRAETEVARRALSSHPIAEFAAPQWLNLALSLAQRGAWDSSMAAARQYVSTSPTGSASLYEYRLAAVGAWLGAIDTTAVAPARMMASHSANEQTPDERAEVAWLDGIAAVARRERDALATARQALRATKSPSVAVLDRSLAAFDLELSGRRATAADSLSRLEFETADAGGHRPVGCGHPFVAAIDRLAAARWLTAAGEVDRAAKLLRWNEALWPRPYCFVDVVERVLSPIASLEQARVEEARGHGALAERYYAVFLAQYDMPTPLERHLVDEARAALSTRRLERP